MEKKRKHKLMLRWSLITGGMIALFWAIYYLVTGQVPVVTSIKMTPEWTLQLPLGISRWWDILIGPIWSTIIILISTSQRTQKDNNLLVAGLGVGLGVGLVAGLGAIIKCVCSKNFWRAIGNWLLAKNEKTEKV